MRTMRVLICSSGTPDTAPVSSTIGTVIDVSVGSPEGNKSFSTVMLNPLECLSSVLPFFSNLMEHVENNFIKLQTFKQ